MLEIQTVRTQRTSVNDIELDNQISLYPNPANDFVIIDFKDFIGNVNEIILYDMYGRYIFSENIANFAETIRFPLGNLSDGIYFVQIYSDKGTLTKKVIVKK